MPYPPEVPNCSECREDYENDWDHDPSCSRYVPNPEELPEPYFNDIEEWVKGVECSVCSAVVVNTDQHYEFHRLIQEIIDRR